MDLIKILIRSLIYKTKLPKEFWYLVVNYTIWIKNRVPTSALLFEKAQGSILTSVTLFEAFREAVPDFSKVKVFGCAV